MNMKELFNYCSLLIVESMAHRQKGILTHDERLQEIRLYPEVLLFFLVEWEKLGQAKWAARPFAVSRESD